jgi:hypothetical protein
MYQAARKEWGLDIAQGDFLTDEGEGFRSSLDQNPPRTLPAEQVAEEVSNLEADRIERRRGRGWASEFRQKQRRFWLDSFARAGITSFALKTVKISGLKTAHDRKPCDWGDVGDYVEARKRGSPFPPILLVRAERPDLADAAELLGEERSVSSRRRVWDGNHRVRAAQCVGDDTVAAYVPIETNPPARARAIPPMPALWWRRPPPNEDAVCYRTKIDALNKFLSYNWRAVEEWGGPGREDLPSEFDAINAKYGLKGARQVKTLAAAAWWAMPGPAPWCLATIDVESCSTGPRPGSTPSASSASGSRSRTSPRRLPSPRTRSSGTARRASSRGSGTASIRPTGSPRFPSTRFRSNWSRVET